MCELSMESTDRQEVAMSARSPSSRSEAEATPKTFEVNLGPPAVVERRPGMESMAEAVGKDFQAMQDAIGETRKAPGPEKPSRGPARRASKVSKAPPTKLTEP